MLAAVPDFASLDPGVTPHALEFPSDAAHTGLVDGGAHASHRTKFHRRDVLLSPLRSTLFGDALAAPPKRKQRCEMRRVPANDGQVGLDQGPHLQAYSSA